MPKTKFATFKDYYNDPSSGSWQNIDTEISKRYILSLLPLLKDISQGLPATGLAVDVGCGGGKYTQLLSNYFDKIHGYDFSERLIQEGRRKFPGIRFAVADATNLPLENASVDFAMSAGLTECLNRKELRQYVAEISRILAPGGVSIFRAWSKYSPGALFFGRFRWGEAANYNKLYFYTRREITEMLREFGLENIRIMGALLVGRWWPLIPIIGRRMWFSHLKKIVFTIEKNVRNLPLYETYWAIATKSIKRRPFNR